MSQVDKSDYIDAVPPEIWAKIFLQAIQPPNRRSVCDLHDALSQLNTCLSLSQTCGKWRDISLSRPLLWSTMVIHLHGGGSYPNVHMVKLIIERSANTQLSIDLRVTDMMDEKMFRDPTSAANLCMDILLGSLARWHDLRVYLRGSALPLPMIWLLRTSLERLQLDAQLIFPIVDHAHTRLWARSPKLDKLFLSYSDYTSWRPPIPHTEQVPKMLPYSQLTSLYIHTSIAHGAPSAVVSAHDVVSIFHDSPNLVSCIFTNIAVLSDSSVVTMKRSVNMPRLEYLHLGGFPDKERVELPLTDILAYIMAPNLSVIAFTNIQSWGQDEFESFILRSVCSLKEIHILNPNNFGPTTLLPILRSLPSVQGHQQILILVIVSHSVTVKFHRQP